MKVDGLAFSLVMGLPGAGGVEALFPWLVVIIIGAGVGIFIIARARGRGRRQSRHK